MSKLALLGGPRAVSTGEDLVSWPVITPATEEAVLEVLRRGKISDLDITVQFEREFADWLGVEYALAHNTGTAAVHCALFGLGIGRGDEIICPSMTYWASCAPVLSLGGTVLFADIDSSSLCIDPRDIERCISERTKAIVVVHYSGMPADMEAILSIAGKHGLAVLEDCSHSHGSLYNGKMTGTLGDVAAFSMMSAKSMPIGEGGMLATNDRRIYERAIAFAHYARHGDFLTIPEIRSDAGIPWGAYKYRLNQLCSAVGREQLKSYGERMDEIDRGMNLFWDLLEGVPGIGPHRPPKDSGHTMGGWYNPLGHYRSEELGGLSITRFCEALRAEGVRDCNPGCNLPLHTHPLFNELDVYGDGKPTNLSASSQRTEQAEKDLRISSEIQSKVFKVPWFRHYRRRAIEENARAFCKVTESYGELLPGDPGDPQSIGGWGRSSLLVSR
jgi:dTDP-4-amino-4,6-dideoxygalactose transaminase